MADPYVIIQLVACGPIPAEQVRAVVPTYDDGTLVREFDHTARGVTSLRCTDVPSLAKRFDTMREALEFAHRVGVPEFRPDGEANRPLMAFTIAFHTIHQDDHERVMAEWN